MKDSLYSAKHLDTGFGKAFQASDPSQHRGLSCVWSETHPVLETGVCGMVWCGVVGCGMAWCGMVGCGVVWCGMVWYGVVWCGVVWCGVVWCGVVWCGVVWCGVV